jgi:hypothetical protein
VDARARFYSKRDGANPSAPSRNPNPILSIISKSKKLSINQDIVGIPVSYVKIKD